MTELEQAQAYHDELYTVICAQEGWSPLYKKTPKHWKQLMRQENRMTRMLTVYFKNLALRAPTMIDWHAYQQELSTIKAYDVAVDFQANDQSATDEQVLISVVFEQTLGAAKNGSSAAEELYKKWVSGGDLNSQIQKASMDHAAELVKELDKTSINRIKQSIQTSIKLHENIQQATERLQKYGGLIYDPTRADLIARTEIVSAYQRGKYMYALESGATYKVWSSLPGACEICSSVTEDPVPVKDSFETGDGPIDWPPAHPRCRCDAYYVYGTMQEALDQGFTPDEVTE